jgi:hypothetical protein
MTTMPDIIARWESQCGTGLEHLVLKLRPEGATAESVVIGTADDPVAVRYRMVMDAGWRVQELRAEAVGTNRRLHLLSDGAGHWRDGDDRPLPHLDGAIDIDLSISPFTNTLPIRRLAAATDGPDPALGIDIVTAYVSVPDLDVMADPQRYTRIDAGGVWLYQSRDSDFRREIKVDGHGLVVDYPGLFRRVL